MDINSQFLGVADKYFTKISDDKDNSTVLQDTVEIEKMRERIVSLVEKADKDGIVWWEVKEFFSVFDELFTFGMILLPLDIIERIRWIALVCMAVCQMEEISYEYVFMSLDFLPDEVARVSEEYEADWIEKVIRFRHRAADRGWKSLLP